MAGVETFEILILGGGKAGKTLAMDMARAGRKVAVVERGLIGGSCINVACIPTKALIRSAQIATFAAHAAGFGVRAAEVATDMPAVSRRVAGIVAGMVDDHWRLFAESGVELVVGEGRFVAPRAVEAVLPDGRTRTLTAERIFLNLGSKAAVPDIPGLRDADPMTHVEALRIERLPRHLLVLGGGYVGLEMAQAFRHLGSEVTVIERGPQVAAREDADLARAIQDVLEEDGVAIHLNAQIRGVEGRSGRNVAVRITGGEGDRVVEGSDILVAAGRIPQTRGIGLEIAGVELDERGFIKVDEHLATTAAGISALGEAAGSPMFTHVSLDDYRVAKSVILGGGRTTRGRLIPYAVFIEPEVGRVGLSENDARERAIPVRVATLAMSNIPRARTMSETRGFMKALVSAETDSILGFAMLGAHAGEVVTAVQVAMWGDLPYTALRDGIIAHPTMAEGLNLLFARVAPS